MQKYLSFTVGGLELGVDMTSVLSIEQGSAFPGENPGALQQGTVSYGGQELPLYNGSLLIGGSKAHPIRAFDSKILIVRTQNGAIALSVDRVSSVMEVPETDLSVLPPVFSGMARTCFPAVLRGPSGLIPLVSPDAVVPAALTVQMSRLDAEATACQPLVTVGAIAEPEACGEVETAELFGDGLEGLGVTSPAALDDPAAEMGFEAMAGLGAESAVLADHETPLPPVLESEASGVMFPAVPDDSAVDMGFEAMADLVAEPEVSTGAEVNAGDPLAVAPSDIRPAGVSEEPFPEPGGEAVADHALVPEVCMVVEEESLDLLDTVCPVALASPGMGGGDLLDDPMPQLGDEAVADPAFEPGACAEGEVGADVTPARGCFVYVESSEVELSAELQDPSPVAAGCADEHGACITFGGDVEAAEVAFPTGSDDPVTDLTDDLAVAPLPEVATEANEKREGGLAQEKELIAKLMEKAITPDLLEKVVDRVVISMMTELVSDLTSDAREKRDASPLY